MPTCLSNVQFQIIHPVQRVFVYVVMESDVGKTKRTCLSLVQAQESTAQRLQVGAGC